jgi:hypothetical protein
MKKRNLLGLLLLAPYLYCQAQDTTYILERTVFAFAGDFSYSQDSAYTLSWTLGEPIIDSVTGKDLTLYQGFQHAEELIVDVEEALFLELGVKAYPNPTSSAVILQIEEEALNQSPLWGYLYDLGGRLLLVQPLRDSQTSFDLDNQPAGMYLIAVTDGRQVRTLKVQKVSP